MSPPTERRQDRRRTARRQRLAVGAAAVLAAGTGIFVGSRVGHEGGDGNGARQSASEPHSAPACPARIAGDPQRLAGQMLVARLEATATPELLRAARAGEIGGVIAFPPLGIDPSALRAAVARLQSAARAGGNPPLLVATDQEGGEVERLPGPPDRAPAELAAAGKAAAVAEGRATARYLKELGIDVDLAPVLDVAFVPDAFIASRTFGDDEEQVSTLGVGFAEGLQAGGVAATAKHFPGLGLATANTDLAPSSIATSRGELRPGLEPFAAAIEAGVPLIMVSNAIYPAYEESLPAGLSPRIVDGLLRDQLGFDGAVITDDLLAGAVSGAGYGAGDAAVAAAAAGADLLLFARAAAPDALPALVRALRGGRLDQADLRDACARILGLKTAYAG